MWSAERYPIKMMHLLFIGCLKKGKANNSDIQKFQLHDLHFLITSANKGSLKDIEKLVNQEEKETKRYASRNEKDCADQFVYVERSLKLAN